MSVWASRVSSSKPLVIGPQSTTLTITQAALVSGESGILCIKVENEKFVLGTLRVKERDHMKLSVTIWGGVSEFYELSVVGANARIDITGFLMPRGDSSDSEDNQAPSPANTKYTPHGNNKGKPQNEETSLPHSAGKQNYSSPTQSVKKKSVSAPSLPVVDQAPEKKLKNPEPKIESGKIVPEPKKESGNIIPEPKKGKKRKLSEGGEPKNQPPVKKATVSPKSQFRCAECKKFFKGEKGLDTHRKTYHSNPET